MKQEQSSQNRNELIDVIKGVTIVLVVLGHCIQFGSGVEYYNTEAYFEEYLFKIIYSFHMPIFALVSGYLMYFSIEKKDTWKILKSKMKTLLVPMVTWSTITETTKLIFRCMMHVESPIYKSVKGYIVSLAFGLWFLKALLFGGVITLIIERIFKGKIYIYFLLVVISLFLPAFQNSDLYFFVLPYYYLGLMFHKYKCIDKIMRILDAKKSIYVTITLVVFWLFMLSLYTRQSYIYTTHLTLLGSEDIRTQLFIDLFRWLIGLIGSLAFIMLLYLLFRKKENAFLNKIIGVFAHLGASSICIYMLNSFVNSVLLKVLKNMMPNLFLWIIETAVSIVVFYLFYYVIKKYKLPRILLLGGRNV